MLPKSAPVTTFTMVGVVLPCGHAGASSSHLTVRFNSGRRTDKVSGSALFVNGTRQLLVKAGVKKVGGAMSSENMKDVSFRTTSPKHRPAIANAIHVLLFLPSTRNHSIAIWFLVPLQFTMEDERLISSVIYGTHFTCNSKRGHTVMTAGTPTRRFCIARRR